MKRIVPVPKTEAEAVEQYKPFVWKNARKFAGSKEDLFEDFLQEGLFAVAVAFRTWSPDGGANFLTWIHEPVRHAMLRVLKKDHAVRPRSGKNGGKAKMIPLDAPLVERDVDQEHHGYESSLRDLLTASDSSPEEQFLRKEQGAPLAKAVSRLPARERQIIRMRFVEGKTLAEIGLAFGISRERVRQLERDALAVLKSRLPREASSD